MKTGHKVRNVMALLEQLLELSLEFGVLCCLTTPGLRN